MNNLFKKNAIETGSVQGLGENVISAKEALKMYFLKYSVLPTELIFKTIQKRAKEGFRNACFEGAYVNGAQLSQLRELGYKIDISTNESTIPYFIVSW